jgi:hypothetical protein
MELAKVRNTTGVRVRTYTVPSTHNDYTFQHFTDDECWVSVDNVKDAEYFEGCEGFAVEWTPTGRVVKATYGPVSSAKKVLKEQLGYRDKQKLAKERGIKANQSEEELEEELEQVVEQLAEQMEHQR